MCPDCKAASSPRNKSRNDCRLKKRPRLLHSLRRADNSGCRLSRHQIADARSSENAHGTTNGAAGGDRRRVIHTLASVQSGLELGLFNLPGLLAAAPAIVFQREGDFVALVEGADPRPLKRARMDEHVLGAVLGSDEAKTLGAIEELDCPGDSHEESLSRCA